MSSKAPVAKERLDRLLVSQGLSTSREIAVRTILAGGVRVDGTVVDKPARLVRSKPVSWETVSTDLEG